MTTTRKQRQQQALSADFFKLNELSFEQLLSWAKKFASTVVYRDEHGIAKGSWQELFENDELIVCAAILSFDINACKQQFKSARTKGPQAIQDYLIYLFKQFNSWYQQLPAQPLVAYQLKLLLLNHYQSELIKPFHQLVASLDQQQRHSLSEFDSLWQLKKTIPFDSTDVSQCFYKILISFNSLKIACQDLFNQSLTTGEHAPQLALYISFLKLFEQAQRQINQFIQRHLDFYYQDVLGQLKQISPPETVYLKLSLQTNANANVQIHQDEIFSPGVDETFQRIDYHANQALLITDAQVSELVNLTFRRDRLISPEHETGLVCGISKQHITMNPTLSPSDAAAKQTFELFNCVQSDNDEKIGLAISSPILTMAQGYRQITLNIYLKEAQSASIYQQLYRLNNQEKTTSAAHELALLFEQIISAYQYSLPEIPHVSQTAQILAETIDEQTFTAMHSMSANEQFRCVYRLFLLALMEQTNEPEAFFKVFGMLMSRYTLAVGDWLDSADIEKIKARSHALLSGPALATITQMLELPKVAIFYQLYSHLFDIKLLTEHGWTQVESYQIESLQQTRHPQFGFVLDIHLEPGFAAIIHSDDVQLELTLKKQTNCFPYSIFRSFEFSQLKIQSNVRQLKHTQLFNSDGQTDPNQPFYPFSVQPTNESYLIVASEELARKQLKTLTFNIDWANLPQGSDGFSQHYANYNYSYRNFSFEYAVDVLNNGQWQPLSPLNNHLFSPAQGRLNKSTQLVIPAMSQAFSPVRDSWPQVPYSQQSVIRNGLFRIRLTAPDVAFGHQQWGPLLSQTLIENTKNKKHPKTLPNAPYTPLIAQLSLDYQAQSDIKLGTLASSSPTKIFHIHPLGREKIYPNEAHALSQPPRLLPDYPDDGYLFIGIKATELSGYLNLFFALDGQSQILTPYPSTEYHWRFLVGNRWRSMSAQHIVQDNTQGFIASGIITIEAPEAIDTHHDIMPDGLYWLSVSTNKGVGKYPNCQQLVTNAIAVNGQTNRHQSSLSAWQIHPKQTSLGKIIQLTTHSSHPEQESREQWIERVSERLRHKGYAITAWDYEHLILQEFPHIGAVSCFPHQCFDSDKPKPGNILIIVTEDNACCHHNPCQGKAISSAKLLAISRFLTSINCNYSHIEVRNPYYESIQVRAQVTLNEGFHHGQALRQLDHAISQHLCPWDENSVNQGLGWKLSLDKLSAFISQQAAVAHVRSLSVLKISPFEQSNYALQDSATSEEPIQARYRWGMLIPATHHQIEISHLTQDIAAQPTGVGQLAIGEQFIIQQCASSQKAT